MLKLKGDRLVKEIRIENVRSLKDTGWIPLKPVTLLVGQNSSGKSTFLRTFPLLKQSIRKRTDGPLLWAGDVDDYVDFGSFSETIHRKADNQSIRLGFKIPASYLGLEPPRRKKQQDIEYSMEIKSLKGRDNVKGRDYVSRLNVRILKSTFEFDFPIPPSRFPESGFDSEDFDSDSESATSIAESVKVNGHEIMLNPDTSNAQKRIEKKITLNPVASNAQKRLLKSMFGFFLPPIESFWQDVENRYASSLSTTSTRVEELYQTPADSVFRIAQHIGRELCRGTSADKAFSPIPYESSPYNMASDMLSVYQSMSEEDKERDSLIFQLLYFYSAFGRIEQYLEDYYQQVHYVAPVRATAQRYYRRNNVSIDEVDFQGVNVPLFLAGMPREERHDFRKWTKQHFGFQFFTEDLRGVFISVKISADADGKGVNLADAGFGYSQILPIIIQLWNISSKKRMSSSKRTPVSAVRRRPPVIIAVEQPELHLHPELQAKLVRTLIAAIDRARENGIDLQLLLETHSETIVNCFGLSIADGKLSPDDVSVALFDKSLGEPDAKVRAVRFTSEGFLEDWPIGFFVPTEG